MRASRPASIATLARVFAALAAFVCAVGLARTAEAQVVAVDLGGGVFNEPSPTSQMTVYTPSIGVTVSPWEFLSVGAHYEADIVSGATEPVKAGPLSSPDVISQASIHDVRHVASGTVGINRKNTSLSATYTYGTEHDYRSQAISVSAATEFLQRNTRLELSYGRGFDKVCNTAYPQNLDPTRRQRLDSSKGCFTKADDRQSQAIDLDTFGVGWTQSWTPVFTTQLTLNFGLQHGFLGNPYRGVVIGAAGDIAQEHHPDNRGREAASLRGKYYVRPIETTFGLGFRAYRDTWDIISTTYEIEAERYVLPWLRAQVRGRYYHQTGAIFWSDDYTGGEPAFGPRGQYWSGDREVSPLHSFAVGGRALAEWKGTRDERLAGMLLDFAAGGSFDVIKTELEDFSLAGDRPNDTTAFVIGLSVHGGF